MNRTARHWLGLPLIVAAISAGCVDDAPLGPDLRSPSLARLAAPAADQVSTAVADADSGVGLRGVDLGTCDNLRVPEGNKLAFKVHAAGVQIYRWDGTSWSFVAPSALLFADAEHHGEVGSHYAGPTWESVSGSKVVAVTRERCTPDPDAVAWLLLEATSTEGAGIFARVTFIQRVNTAGGNAPSEPGRITGEEARVPYTTQYVFYRAQ